MKNRRLSSILLGSSLIVFTAAAHAGDVIKANNTISLNVAGAPPTGSWVAGVVPTSTDVAVWDSTVTAPNVSALGGDLSWQGIKVTNVAGTANPSATTAGIQITNASSANTLTLGTAGIDMSTATQALLIQAKIAFAGSQTWNIANANTNGAPFAGSGINAGMSEDLMFPAQANATMNLGGFTLGTSGAGSIGISSGYTLSNGTLNLSNANTWIQSGGSRTTVLASDLTVTVAANSNLRLRANSGAGGFGTNSAAAISVSGSGSRLQFESNNSGNSLIQSGNLTLGNGSTLEAIVNNTGAFTISAPTISTSLTAASMTWLVNGSSAGNASGVAVSGNITGNGVIAYQNTASGTNGQIRLLGDNSGFTGTMNLNGGSNNRSLRLTSATAGSSAATWTVGTANTLQVDGVAVSLGTLNGAGTVTNSHATNTAAISVGAGTFSGVISNGAPALGMAVTKTGGGTLALTGANTYTGPTDIQGGTLTTTTAQTGGGAMTVADNATFGVTQLSNGATFNATTLTMGSVGSTLELTPAAGLGAALVTAGTFTVNGSTTLRVKGLPVAGTTLVSSTSASGLGSLILAMPFRINGTLNISSGTSVVLATVQDETPKWRNGDGVWDTNPTGNWKTTTTSTTTNYLEDGVGLTDSVIFDDTSSSGTTLITVTLNSTVTPVAITVAGTKDYIISGSGAIAGTTGITKNGSAALTLATANTFSGSVLLNQGTLNINNATALGSGTLTIAGGTILNNTSGSAKVATNAQNWNGDFTFTGSNDLTLGAAAMNASRQVTVSAGTLTVGGISGIGFGLTKEGAGTLALSATSSYSGATLINAGVLKASAANAFSATSALTLANVSGAALDLNGFNQTVNSLSGGGATGGNVLLGGGVLTANNASDSTFAGALSGAGGLTKSGVAVLTLSGDTTGYTGATTISGGVLDVGNVGNFLGASGALTMSNGSVIQGSGTITRDIGSVNNTTTPITATAIVSGNGGFAARGGQLDVTLDDPTDAGSSFFNMAGSSNRFGNGLVLGSATADSKVRILSAIGINNSNATRTISVNPGTGTASAELAGVVSNGLSGGNNGINKTGNGELILSAANTYTGDTVINAGSVTLAATGQLTFVPTTNGAVNKVRGVGSVALNGAVSFNLAGANTTPGNTWKIVDDTLVTGLASNTIGATFSVVGFTEASDVWTRIQGGSLWTFTESSRVLTVQPAAGFAGWITGNFGGNTVPSGQQGANDDPDNDGIDNLVEYAILNGDPTRSTASPAIISGNLVTFNKNTTATGISYALEKSETLVAWSPATPTTNDANVITYTLAPPTPSKEFVRLKVTQP